MDKRMKILAICMMLVFTIGTVAAAEEAEGTSSGNDRWQIAVAAALAIGMSSLAAAYGIAHAGSAAMAAMAEKPEIATWGIIIVALAEGLALYGLVIAFMLIGKV